MINPILTYVSLLIFFYFILIARLSFPRCTWSFSSIMKSKLWFQLLFSSNKSKKIYRHKLLQMKKNVRRLFFPFFYYPYSFTPKKWGNSEGERSIENQVFNQFVIYSKLFTKKKNSWINKAENICNNLLTKKLMLIFRICRRKKCTENS